LTGSQEVVGSSPIFSTNKISLLLFYNDLGVFLVLYGICTATPF